MTRYEIYKAMHGLIAEVDQHFKQVPGSYPALERMTRDIALACSKLEALHRFVTEEGYDYSDCCRDLALAEDEE